MKLKECKVCKKEDFQSKSRSSCENNEWFSWTEIECLYCGAKYEDHGGEATLIKGPVGAWYDIT